MKKTFKVKFPVAQAYIQTPTCCGTIQEPMTDFIGQEVTITVESAEEKPKVQMCESFDGCHMPARWEIERSDIGRPFHCCDEHTYRVLSNAPRTYAIKPIPPQPPEPVVVEWVEWEIDCRDQTSTLIKVPTILQKKRIKVRLTEITD